MDITSDSFFDNNEVTNYDDVSEIDDFFNDIGTQEITNNEKISKTSSFSEFCQIFKIDPTLGGKILYDLRFNNRVDEEIIRYIWNDSEKLRNYLTLGLNDNKLLFDEDIENIKNEFNTIIIDFVNSDNNCDLMYVLQQQLIKTKNMIGKRKDIIERISKKNAELFSVNMSFQSLPGFKKFVISKNFLDIMNYEEYDNWIDSRNAIENNLSELFKEYIAEFGYDNLQKNKDLYKIYLNNVGYLDEPWSRVNNGRFKYLDNLLNIVCKYKKYHYKDDTQNDRELCDFVYLFLVNYFKKYNRSDYFQIIMSNNYEPFFEKKPFSKRISFYFNQSLEIETAKLYRGGLERDKTNVDELVLLIKQYAEKTQDRLLLSKIDYYNKMNSKTYVIKKMINTDIKAINSFSRKIKIPVNQFEVIVSINK